MRPVVREPVFKIFESYSWSAPISSSLFLSNSLLVLFRCFFRVTISFFFFFFRRWYLSVSPVVLYSSQLGRGNTTQLQSHEHILLFISCRLFDYYPQQPKRGISESKVVLSTARFEYPQLLLTLEPFWSPDWNHPMRSVVSGWPWDQCCQSHWLTCWVFPCVNDLELNLNTTVSVKIDFTDLFCNLSCKFKTSFFCCLVVLLGVYWGWGWGFFWRKCLHHDYGYLFRLSNSFWKFRKTSIRQFCFQMSTHF